MTWPTLTVNAGFGDTMFTASPGWTDITGYVQEITIQRGRSATTGNFRTGKATVLLDNSDGRFTPENTAGAYTPNVVIGLPIRIQANYSATDYDLFYGSVREWPPKKHGPNYASVRVPLADGFYTLNLEDLDTQTYAEELCNVRIGNVLDDIGWAGALRTLATALAQVQATTFASPASGGEQPALRHLLDVAESEAGVLFMGQDGKVIFQNRLQHSGAGSPAITFDGDDFSDIVLNYTDKYTWNVVRISREDGGQVEVDASGSAPRSVLTRDVMPMSNDPEALNVGEWLSAVYGSQRLQVERLKFHMVKNANAFTADLLSLDLRDSVTVQHTPVAGDAVDQDVAIEQIVHRIRPQDWQTTLHVVPLTATELADYWILDTSLLDTQTVLA